MDETLTETAGRQAKTATVIVNTMPHEVAKNSEIKYEALVALAYPDRPASTDDEFQVTYTRGPHGNGAGTLLPGEAVRAREGMIFNVYLTTRS